MDEILPGKLYLGDIKDATASDLYLHIDRAIAVCTEYECHHNCPDSWNAPFPDGQITDGRIIHRAVKLIHEGIENGQRVLIHCAAGISRSPMVTACYLVKSHAIPGLFDYDRAIEYIQRRRQKVDPDERIMRSGRSYCASGFKLEKKPVSGIIL